MRLSKNSARILAASLCLAVVLTTAGCSNGETDNAEHQPPASSSGIDSSSSSRSAVENESGSSSSEAESSTDLSIYPIADSSVMMHGDTWSYSFHLKPNGEIKDVSAMIDEVVPKEKLSYQPVVKDLPFDYNISTYVWDGNTFRCKQKRVFPKVSKNQLVSRDGYKYFCEIDAFYTLRPRSYVDVKTGTVYEGWIPNEFVSKAIKEASGYHIITSAFDSIPDGINSGKIYRVFNGDFYIIGN